MRRHHFSAGPYTPLHALKNLFPADGSNSCTRPVQTISRSHGRQPLVLPLLGYGIHVHLPLDVDPGQGLVEERNSPGWTWRQLDLVYSRGESNYVNAPGQDLANPFLLVSPQFAITLARGLTVTSRYIINLVDLWRARGREDAPVWEGKSMCVSLVELVHGKSTCSAPRYDSRRLTRITSRCSSIGHLCHLLLHHLLPLWLDPSQPHTFALLGVPFLHGQTA